MSQFAIISNICGIVMTHAASIDGSSFATSITCLRREFVVTFTQYGMFCLYKLMLYMPETTTTKVSIHKLLIGIILIG
jgi:hypothetical protein